MAQVHVAPVPPPPLIEQAGALVYPEPPEVIVMPPVPTPTPMTALAVAPAPPPPLRLTAGTPVQSLLHCGAEFEMLTTDPPASWAVARAPRPLPLMSTLGASV